MDGINAIFAVAAIYSTIVFGMNTTDIIMLGIGTNLSAGIGSWFFSFIEKKIGSKNVIVFSLICISMISLIILFIDQKNLFILFAILLSSFFGPLQSASRVYFVKQIPDTKKYEFFGFYSFSGKVTSFIGPILYGTIAYIFSSPKVGMTSLLLFFIIGLFLVIKVENDN
jgi:UMF1 family MFS transporter